VVATAGQLGSAPSKIRSIESFYPRGCLEHCLHAWALRLGRVLEIDHTGADNADADAGSCRVVSDPKWLQRNLDREVAKSIVLL
jgi:hypothetical protein